MIRVPLNKGYRSSCIALLVAMVISATVLAGTVKDQGVLVGRPANANYVAWIDTQRPPNQVLTEDGYNSAIGVDKGYVSGDWTLNASNFDNPPAFNGQRLYMIFGGLADDSGRIWTYDFIYDKNTPITDHGTVGIEASGTCPTLQVNPLVGTSRTLVWDGPGGYYLIYRSMNESGADNDASNGRYDFVAHVSSGGSLHTYTDTDPELAEWPSWYIVLPANAAGEITGCHSEEGTPTAVTLTHFEAVPQNDHIQVTWETATELNNLGFNLYRSETAAGPWTQLNAALIPAQQPGSITGATYEWLDTSVIPNVTYFYRLEDVDIYGMSTFHGPVSATAAEPSALSLIAFEGRPTVNMSFLLLAFGVTMMLTRQRKRSD